MGRWYGKNELIPPSNVIAMARNKLKYTTQTCFSVSSDFSKWSFLMNFDSSLSTLQLIDVAVVIMLARETYLFPNLTLEVR